MNPYAEIEHYFAQRIAETGWSELLERELTMALENQKAQDMAELHSYAECGYCHRLYTEAQWAKLRPDSSKPWANDSTHLEEHRFCSVCSRSLSVVERVRERVAGRAISYVVTSDTCCSRCRVPILAGDQCVVRVNEAGHRERGLWCSAACEGSR